MPLLSYDEVLQEIHQDTCTNVLLGNGFSRSLLNDIFSYQSLFQSAEFGGRDATIRSIFENLGTYDFEAVARCLESAKLVVERYDNANPLLEQISLDLIQLKKSLIQVISRTHPTYPHQIDDDKYESTREFLSRFKNIFTLNYDLLLYWARNKDNLRPENWRTDDGFRGGARWKEFGTQQNVHFLHGALHIYEDQSGVKKFSSANEGEAIINQVRDRLNNGNFPIFVSEPTSQKKLRRIDRSPYLSSSLRALRASEGCLIVLGHSMDDNDKHIFKQIRESATSQIYVSIFGREDTESNRTAIANATANFARIGRTLKFFDATTVPIWRPAEHP